MVNTHPFNTRLFNGSFANSEVFSMDQLVFEGFSLSDGSTMLLTNLIYSGPTREIVGAAIPRGDGEYIIGDYFRELVIEARGIVEQDAPEELDTYLDTIRKSLRVGEGNLDLSDAAGTVKRFVATVDNFNEMFADRKGYHITVCPWVIRFRCKVPFGQSRGYDSDSCALSSSPITQSVVNAGTIEALPVITLIFSSASAVTTVNVGNETTGEEIETTPDGGIAAGDILVFDSERMEVTLNGTPIDFTGGFPILDVGPNLIELTVSAGSFVAYATVSRRRRYL